jgi:hypothetical protein
MPPRYPTAAELGVLVALKEHHYLTVEQVMRLTGRSSLRATQQRLKDLKEAGLVAKHDRRSSNVLRPLRAAWSLTARSKAYLEDAGMVVLPPRQPRPYTLDHLLSVNDVLIQARLLAQESSVELRELYHDRELRTWTPSLSVVPDGYLQFDLVTSTERESFSILLEVDMGTMDRRRWQEKVSRYLPFLAHELEEVFGTDVATIAVVVNDSRQRVHDLKRWTEQELARHDSLAQADIFYFTHIDPEASPRDFFFSSRFLVGGHTGGEPLLPMPSHWTLPLKAAAGQEH